MKLPNLGKVGIVARGGGYKVAFTIGICKCLSFLGIDVAIISAVSSSVLTFATWIANKLKTEQMEEESKKIEVLGDNFAFNKQYIKLALHLKESSLFSDAGLMAVICGQKDLGLKGIDLKALVECETELIIAINNEAKEEREFISTHDPQFKKDPQKIKLYLRATASPMGLLPPVKIGDCFYSDGMYPDLECAIRAGCDTIFIVDNDQPPISHLETLSWLRRLPYNISAMHDDLMEKEIERILKTYPDFILIEQDTKTHWLQKCYKRVRAIAASTQRERNSSLLIPHRIIVLSPEKTIGKLGTLEFNKGDLTTAIAHGYDCALKTIQSL